MISLAQLPNVANDYVYLDEEINTEMPPKLKINTCMSPFMILYYCIATTTTTVTVLMTVGTP